MFACCSRTILTGVQHYPPRPEGPAGGEVLGEAHDLAAEAVPLEGPGDVQVGHPCYAAAVLGLVFVVRGEAELSVLRRAEV